MSRNKLILLAILVLVIIFSPGYIKLQELKAKNKSLLLQIEGLKKDNTRLLREIDKLEKDTLYIEKRAREKMGVSREGEIIYKVIDSGKKVDE